MLQAGFSAKAAARAQQTRIDVISNNIANVSTHGFKASRVSFQDTLYSNMVRPVGGELQRGTGMRVGSIDYLLTPGTPLGTGNPLDLCISNDGFFAVENNRGEVQYTRNGAFNLSPQADGNYLVTEQGYHVLDENGQRIRIPDGALVGDISVGADGTLTLEDGAPFAKLGVFSFANVYGLESAGDNLYNETVISGQPQASGNPDVIQGYLEGSNVDVANEMVQLMRTQRAFSFVSRALTTADEMEGIANNMRA